MKSVRINELRLRRYRAFSDARLEFDDVTFLVGRNGAGKSTLMDALSFMREALTDSIGVALERRGNLEGICSRVPLTNLSAGVSIAVSLRLPDDSLALYGFKVAEETNESGYRMIDEILRVDRGPSFQRSLEEFNADGIDVRPVIDSGSLIFPLIAGADPVWKQIHEGLRSIAIHQFSPPAIRAEPKIGGAKRLSRDGGNAGDILHQTVKSDIAWIMDRLRVIVPGLIAVSAKTRAGRRVIVFEQKADIGAAQPYEASAMSDGTLRALAILLALRQTPRPSILLLDEIEDSLHPRAHAVLLEAIEEAGEDFPVVLSTHNPEILSLPEAKGERIRIVQWDQGSSKIYHLAEETLTALKPPDSVGDLLRFNALWGREHPSVVGAEEDFFKIM